MLVWLLYLVTYLPIGAPPSPPPSPFQKILRFNVYTFIVRAAASDSTTATVAAYRGSLLLTRFTQPIEGTLTGADVADLDGNRLPELYLYSIGTDSQMRRQVYGWQFLPERLVPIVLTQPMNTSVLYQGRDRFQLIANAICHLFPIAGTGESATTAGRICYRLQPAGPNYQLVAQ